MQETTSAPERLASLERLVERMERENRRWKRAGTLLALGLVGLIAAGFREPTPCAPADGILRGEKLKLSDSAGNTYAEISIDSSGSPLFVLKKDRAHVAMTLNKPALHIRSDDGESAAFIGFDTRNTGKVELTTREKNNAVRMSIRPDGTTGIYVLDEEGFDRVSIEHLSDGNTSLTLREAKNRVRTALGVDASGNSSVILLDSSGRRRVGMVVHPDGTPLLSMEDENASPRMNIRMEFDGSTQLEFVRPDGVKSHSFP